jgi:hypothetical protein
MPVGKVVGGHVAGVPAWSHAGGQAHIGDASGLAVEGGGCFASGSVTCQKGYEPLPFDGLSRGAELYDRSPFPFPCPLKLKVILDDLDDINSRFRESFR